MWPAVSPWSPPRRRWPGCSRGRRPGPPVEGAELVAPEPADDRPDQRRAQTREGLPLLDERPARVGDEPEAVTAVEAEAAPLPRHLARRVRLDHDAVERPRSVP